MPISSSASKTGPLLGDGEATAFGFSFAARSGSEVGVKIDGVDVAGFTVKLLSNYQGGTVTFVEAPALDAVLFIYSRPKFSQDVDFENNGAFLPATLDEVHDRGLIRDLYLKDRVDRAIIMPMGDDGYEVPAAAEGFLGFVNGQPVLSDPTFISGAELPAVVSSRIVMANLTTAANQPIYLTEAGREGVFKVSTSTDALEDEVADDPEQFKYIPHATAPLVFVRQVEKLTPEHAGVVLGTSTPSQVRAALQKLANYCAGGRAALVIPERGLSYDMDYPLIVPSGLRMELFGTLRNTRAGTTSVFNNQGVLFVGHGHPAYLSEGYLLGNSWPWKGSLVGNEFTLIAASDAINKVVAGEETLYTAADPSNGVNGYAALNVGDSVYIGTQTGYLNNVGTNGTGGVQVIRDIMEVAKIIDKVDGNKFILDNANAGDIPLAVIGLTDNPAVGGSDFGDGRIQPSLYLCRDAQIFGPGALRADNLNGDIYASRCFFSRFMLDIDRGYGERTLGAQGWDSYMRIKYAVAKRKPWEFAMGSARCVAEFHEMISEDQPEWVVDPDTGIGAFESSSGVAGTVGENSRDIIVRGNSIQYPKSESSGGIFRWNTARHCIYDVQHIQGMKMVGTAVQVAVAGGYVDGKIKDYVPHVVGNRLKLGTAQFGEGIWRFIAAYARDDEAIQEDFQLLGGRFYGTPSIEAVYLEGSNHSITGWFEESEFSTINVAEASNARIDTNLAVSPLNDDTVAEVYRNGVRVWTGHGNLYVDYDAPVDGGAVAATYTPDASLGQVDDRLFIHKRFHKNIAGSLTIGNPTNGTDGQRLILILWNTDATGGTNHTLTFGSDFVDAGSIAAVQPRKAHRLVFDYHGQKWHYRAGDSIINGELWGPNLFANPSFANGSDWAEATEHEIVSGTLRYKTDVAESTTTTQDVRLEAGARYIVKGTVANRTAGGAGVKAAGTAPTIWSTNGAHDAILQAGTDRTDTGPTFSGAANVGMTITNVELRKL